MKSRHAFTTPLFLVLILSCREKAPHIITVTSEIPASSIGITLPHEHIVVDFIGADSVSPDRYDSDSVFIRVLPFLNELKKHQVQTFVECTPNYLGRDVRLLQRLSKE
ncbi:MAG TPA: aryldialkylphosphatase, partial [Flavobacteriales bacterium]|nr:aryldialkylphosphatase [Flavobacteriales bacterium]